MALYRGDTKVSGIGQSFNPENTGTEGQVLTKTCSGYAYCDVSSGGGDTYNIKYLVVGGGGGGNTNGSGGGGGEVLFGKEGFSDDHIDVKVGEGGHSTSGGYGWNMKDSKPSVIMNSDFIHNARGGQTSIDNYNFFCRTCNNFFNNLSGSGYGNACCVSRCYCWGGGGAGGPGNMSFGGPGLCGYGAGGSGYNSGCSQGNCCGDGGTCNNDGRGGIVKICYACDGSGGINTATGGNSCYVCDGYCVHEFTSDGTFCITG